MVTKKKGGLTSEYILGIENIKINDLLEKFEQLYNDVDDNNDDEYNILQECLKSYINKFNYNYAVPIYTNNFIEMLKILDKLFISFSYTKYNDYSIKQINNKLKCSSVFFLKLLNFYSNFYYNKNLQRNKNGDPFANYKIFIFDPNIDIKNFNDKSFIANKLMMMETYDNKYNKLDDLNKKESHETCFKKKNKKKLAEISIAQKQIVDEEIRLERKKINEEEAERKKAIEEDIEIKKGRKDELLRNINIIRDTLQLKTVLKLIKDSQIYNHTQEITDYIIYDDVSKTIIEKLNIKSVVLLNPDLIFTTLNIDESMNFIKNIIKNIKFVDTYIRNISPEYFFNDPNSKDHKEKYMYKENDKIKTIRSQIGIVDKYLISLRQSHTEYYKNKGYQTFYNETKDNINFIFGTIKKNVDMLLSINEHEKIMYQINIINTIIDTQFIPTLKTLIGFNNEIYIDYVRSLYSKPEIRGGIKKKRKVKKMKKYV
jgi:hypothetical protein